MKMRLSTITATLTGLLCTAYCAAQNVPAKVPEGLRQNLILYYDFSNATEGQRVFDLSGHGNDGLPVNVQFVQNGHQGAAACFGLAGSYITVPNKTELNPRRFTEAAWIKTSYTDSIWRRIFDKNWKRGYDLTMGGEFKGKSFEGEIDIEVAESWNHSGRVHVADGQWHHVAGTFDGNDTRLYVDGMPVGGRVHVKNYPGDVDCDLTIGANRSNPDPKLGEVDASFNGMMSDVMLFDRALTPEEIQMLCGLQGSQSYSGASHTQGTMGGPSSQPKQPAGNSESGAANQSEKLKMFKNLLDQGLISKELYDQKVKAVLDGI